MTSPCILFIDRFMHLFVQLFTYTVDENSEKLQEDFTLAESTAVKEELQNI